MWVCAGGGCPVVVWVCAGDGCGFVPVVGLGCGFVWFGLSGCVFFFFFEVASVAVSVCADGGRQRLCRWWPLVMMMKIVIGIGRGNILF